jgi:ComEC/Rec2-related protein
MVLCEVLEEGRASEYSTDATVRILSVNGEHTRVKGMLYLDFSLPLEVGDQLYAYAEIAPYLEETDSLLVSRKENGGLLLSVSVAEEEHGTVRRLSEGKLTPSMLSRESGLRILADRVRDGLRSLLTSRLDGEVGALANGFLIGDISELSSVTLRDFRRAGVFHLLSVSGLHLTVLLGSVEFLLRRLRIPKRVRIPIVSLGGLFLLILTGFAASACRSVLMLLLVYLQFMLAKEYDSITSLFVSGALILLFSPYATNDPGLWMSFQATLGLMTLFSLWDSRLREWSRKRTGGHASVPVRLVGLFVSGVLLTVVANLFLMPILWAVFGELSLVSLLSNVLISPLASVFLVTVPLFTLLCRIPLLGGLIRWGVELLGRGLIGMASMFSRIPGAVISLRYDFCGVLVVAFAAVMLILLFVRLKRKWLFWVVPMTFVVTFAICLTGRMTVFSKTEALYACDGRGGEALALREDDRLAVCDLSYGGWRGANTVETLLGDSYATELDALILSHVHGGHLSMLERLGGRLLLERLYLPMPQTREEALLTDELARLAETLSVRVTVYEEGEELRPWTGTALHAERVRGSAHDALAVTLLGKQERLLYLSGRLSEHLDGEAISERIGAAQTVILGSHGGVPTEEVPILLGENAVTDRILLGSDKLASRYPVKDPEIETLIPTSGKAVSIFSVILS